METSSLSQQQPPQRRGRRPSAAGRGAQIRGMSNGAMNAGSGLNHTSLAAKYDDEKNRIIASCFSKADEFGDPVESYLTHLRMVEDASSPSSPPPPDASQQNKKYRIIILAVRKSGRVRVHKGRENANGSFSIGKTWYLDDLSSIESFTGASPTTAEEETRRQWAGSVGFIITMGKSYYWQASTLKEKDFFISSLLNVYRKYTGGKMPNLLGFLPHELERFVGAGYQSRPSNEQTRSGNSRPPSSRGSQPPSQDARRRDQSREPRARRQPSYDHGLPSRPSLEKAQRPQVYDSRSSQENMRNGSQGQIKTSRPQTPSNHLPASSDLTQMSSPNPRPTTPAERLMRKLDGQSVDSADIQQSGGSGKNGTLANERLLSDQRSQSPDARGRPISPESRIHAFSPGTRPDARKYPGPPPERKRPPLNGPTQSSESDGKFYTPKETTPGGQADERDGRVPPLRGIGALRPDGLDLSPKRKPSDYFPPANSAESRKSGDDIRNGVAEKNNVSKSQDQMPQVDGALSNKTAPLTVSQLQSSETTTSPAKNLKLPEKPEPPSIEEDDDEERHRPGLGPMIKKRSAREVATKLRKAAAAATMMQTFKPRAGGAGERLLAAGKDKINDEPDGITGVVRAPGLRALSNETPKPPGAAKEELPQFQIFTENGAAVQPIEPEPETKLDDAEVAKAKADERKRKRKSDHTPKYAAALGIDARVLRRKGLEVDDILSEFGWDGDATKEKKIDDLEIELRREVGKAEVGSWFSHIEQKDTRVDAVAKLLDDAIAECEELDGLLTLYNLELNTMADDVAFIEAQGQGLQVQTANQKLLQVELRNLLETLSISQDDLLRLRDVSLASLAGIQTAEESLSLLYNAMLTIDPALRQGGMTSDNIDRGSVISHGNTEISNMRAVQEKKDTFRNESILFLGRLKQYMSIAFRAAEQKTIDSLKKSREASLNKVSTHFDLQIHDGARQDLWPYHALMLFARSIETFEWDDLIRAYEQAAKSPYQEEIRENEMAWRKLTRKSTGEEQDVLFTTAEKEDNVVMAARKLTVKRGKTLRSSIGVRPSMNNLRDGKVYAFEAMRGLLDEIVPLILREQNFIVEFFHVSSLSTTDFADAVSMAPPNARKTPNLSTKKPLEPDKERSKRVLRAMEEIFSFWPTGLQNLVEAALRADPLQSIGVLYHIERKLNELEDTNQDFITKTLRNLQGRLETLFRKFIDDQIKGIEDTKVKIKKRKGVIVFMRVFPNFAHAVENMLASANSVTSPTSPTMPSSPQQANMDVRDLVNEVYGRINKAMFESLKFIAKESPAAVTVPNQHLGVPGATSGGDPEDKEALNYHILLIENMNHYLEEVDVKGNPVLLEWRNRAEKELNEHLGLYLDAAIRRPLGKILDFVESTESLLSTLPPDTPPTSLALRASHSRATFHKLLATYDAKELRRGIDALRKRMEKHFGEGEADSGVSRSLLVRVQGEAEKRYKNTMERLDKIRMEVYGDEERSITWGEDDVASAFKR